MINVGEVVAPELGFKTLQDRETIKILGFPFTRTGLQPANTFWNEKIESLRDTVKKIKPDQLTLRGKILLIDSFILSKASYYMDLVPMLKTHLSDLENLCFKTLQCGKTKSPVDRRICQLPQEVEGLAVKNIELWSKCKATMWAKKFFTKTESLWQRILYNMFKKCRV